MISGRARAIRKGRLLGAGDGATFDAAGGDTAVLLFHGYSGTVSELRPLIDGLAAHGYTVRAPLLPGHGTSAHELQDVTYEALTAFAQRELEALVARHAQQVREGGTAHKPRIVVGGFSYGSLLALHLAAHAAPAVDGLVLLGNAVSLPIYTRGPLGAAARLGLRVPDAYLRKFRAADMVDRVAAQRITTYDRQPLRAAMEVYRAGLRERARLPSVTCPTLVLHGARDLVCPPANAAYVARHIGARDVTVRVYPRSAHILAADHDRDEVQRDVLAFLDHLQRQSPSEAPQFV